jgi:hypothetical protein
MSSAVQVCWEKATSPFILFRTTAPFAWVLTPFHLFASTIVVGYLEIEEKWVNVSHDRFVIDPQQAVDLVDENTVSKLGLPCFLILILPFISLSLRLTSNLILDRY